MRQQHLMIGAAMAIGALSFLASPNMMSATDSGGNDGLPDVNTLGAGTSRGDYLDHAMDTKSTLISGGGGNTGSGSMTGFLDGDGAIGNDHDAADASAISNDTIVDDGASKR